MPKRERKALTKQSYFVSEKTALKFISSGCTLLDCALGGGYVLGRIANIVGDRSTAKTALATEAMTNFLRQYPKGKAAYRESEAAFDPAYAEAMGLPIKEIDFGDPENPLGTVEDFARDFDRFLEAQIKADVPGIYVLDSLDALSDEAEMERDIGKGTYGANKPKQLSAFFRTRAREIEKSQVLLLVISQVRDNIGAMFGEKHKRSGGRALDFYCTHIGWLSHIKTLKKTIKGIERPVGITIRCKIKKNKVSFPFREAEFDFEFGFGINDIKASINWLHEVGRLDAIDVKQSELKAYVKELDDFNDAEYNKEVKRVSMATREVWASVETSFLPIRKKYVTSD